MYGNDQGATLIHHWNDSGRLEGWQIGTTRSWEEAFMNATNPAYRLSLIITGGGSGYQYAGDCRDRNLDPSDQCVSRGNIYKITNATETSWYPQLARCCMWLPPAIAPYEITCFSELSDIVCTFVAWNFSNTTATARGSIRLVDGNSSELDVSSFEIGSEMAAGEERTVTARLANGTRSGIAGIAQGLSVDIRLHRTDFPNSFANETVALALGTGRQDRAIGARARDGPS